MAFSCEQFTERIVSMPLSDRKLVGRQLTSLGGFLGVDRSCITTRSRPRFAVEAGVAIDRLPLSSYNFPLPDGFVQSTPLETAVKDAVVHLDQAPFLQLHTRGQIDRHSVDDSILQEPQLWKGISRYLREKNTELILLLYPLGAPSQSRAAHPVPNSGEVMTGITNTAHQSRVLSFAELVKSGATTADFSGRVGECCDEELHSQVVAFPRRRSNCDSERHHHQAPKQPESSPKGHDNHRHLARYWGVVLQSSDGDEAGCYVLKTTDSAVGDCTCVHWSLTRVCSGAPLFDQVSSVWLL